MELPNENNYYGYIYCTTNLVNGMKYLGKHEKHKGKWDGVRKYDRPDNNYYIGSGTLLMRAIKKYGKENFEKDILQYCVDAKDLSESETYWGEYFGVKKSDLFYNIAETGTGGYLGEDIYRDLSIKRKQWYKEGKITGNVFKPGIGSKPFAHKISVAKKGKPWSEKRREAYNRKYNKNT